ncbi:MAG: hypothetical protein WC735_02590 [Candidatus Paceibacterota bacterium]|jgi:hypothetical protein
MLDNKSKIFFGIFAFLVMISLVATYYRYVILKDFAVVTDEKAFNESLEEE